MVIYDYFIVTHKWGDNVSWGPSTGRRPPAAVGAYQPARTSDLWKKYIWNRREQNTLLYYNIFYNSINNLKYF